MEQVILVNKLDEEIGVMEKIQAHAEGRLHRAISVFLFNSRNELLLQQRAFSKYHSPGLWSNTCCTHPQPGEMIADAAARRLYEEMGIACSLQKVFSFVYEAHLEHGLIEHEYDHVYTGITDSAPTPNIAEVAAWKYVSTEALYADVRLHPEGYTAWFKICLEEHGPAIFG